MHSTTDHKGAAGNKPGPPAPTPDPVKAPTETSANLAAGITSGPGLFQLRGASYDIGGAEAPTGLLCQPIWSPPKGYGGQGY